MKCVFACDIDRKARETYAANFGKACPQLKHHLAADITKVEPKDIPHMDVLCAGFPCQPFSVAGKKRGFADANRGNMFFEILRVVDGVRPKALFLENVRNLIRHNGGQTFATIRHEIEQRGYSFVWRMMKATDFGLPQFRPRVYMVCFDKAQVPNWADFRFPDPVQLVTTLSDVLGGHCERAVAKTLMASSGYHRIGEAFCWDGYIVDGKEHRLTPQEARQLMGFPDSFVLPESNHAAMHQLGNSVAVPVIRAIGREIARTLEQGRQPGRVNATGSLASPAGRRRNGRRTRSRNHRSAK